jgi:hypothetical protein
MRRYIIVCLAVAMASFFLLTGAGICQEAAKSEAAPAKAEPAAKAEPEEEAIYGEVLAVNEADGSMTVQYYDYDADEEKNLEVGIDKATKFENAAALKDVKKGDWVDVSYLPSASAKKTAKSVKVEKAEDLEALGDAAPAEGTEE